MRQALLAILIALALAATNCGSSSSKTTASTPPGAPNGGNSGNPGGTTPGANSGGSGSSNPGSTPGGGTPGGSNGGSSGGGSTGGNGGSSGGSSGSGGGSGSAGGAQSSVVALGYVGMPQANSFSGVRVDSTGTASVVPGAPFSAPSGTLSVAAHGKFVFTSAIFPNDSSSQILGYQVDTSTGALTQVSSNQSTTGRAYLALDPSGNYLYAGLYGAGKLYGYHVETSGALTPLAGSPWTLQAESAAYARVTPDGKYVCYADTGGRGAGLINCVQRDPSSGEIPNSTSFLGTAVSNTPFTSFDFTPDGAYLVATEAGISNNVSVFPFQPFGQPAQGTAVQTAATPLAVTVNPGGNLVAVTDQAGTLYLYSRSNGALNRLSSNAVPGHIGTYADFLAFSSSGQYLFVGSGNGVVVYHVDPATGFLSAVSGSPVNIGGLSGPIGAL